MLTSLARQYIVPKKLVTRGDKAGVPCDVCDGMRDAVVAVMGGDEAFCSNGDRVKLKDGVRLLHPVVPPVSVLQQGVKLVPCSETQLPRVENGP